MLTVMKNDRIVLFSCFALGLACVLPAMAAEPVKLSTQQVQKLGIQTSPAQSASEVNLSFPAQVMLPADRQWLISAPAAGLVQSLSAREGDAVKQGQTLVRLHSVQAQNLQLDWQAAKSQADWARAQLQRDQALFQEGLITQARLENSQTQAAQATASEAQKRQAWQDTTGSPGAKSGSLAIGSPARGHVLEQIATLGQRVEAMAPLYRIGQLDPIWVDIQVPVAQASRIRIGDKVSATLPQNQQIVTGHITGQGATVHAASQTVRLFAQLPNPDFRLKPGQLTQVQLTQHGATEAVRVPSQSVLTQGRTSQVFVQKAPGQYELVNVLVQSTSGAQSTVTGLPSGAMVVSKGTSALQSLLGK